MPTPQEAWSLILARGEASSSVLEQGLELTYAQAGRLLDELEDRGLVGAYNGSRPREILSTSEVFADE